MAEGRIANVMQQASGRHDSSDIARVERCAFAFQSGRSTFPEGPTHGRDLDGMRKAGTNEIVTLKRKNLSFVTQSAKRGAEDNSIKVIFEFCAGVER